MQRVVHCLHQQKGRGVDVEGVDALGAHARCGKSTFFLSLHKSYAQFSLDSPVVVAVANGFFSNYDFFIL